MDRLPLELRIRISQYLTCRDLCKLVRVSKSYYFTFTPELYREIRILGTYRESDTNFYQLKPGPNSSKSGPPARCLAYANREHPVFAGFVRSLSLDPFIYQGTPRLNSSRALQETLLPRPVTRQTILRWQKALDSEELDSRQPLRNPWFALLLLQLKNLQRLSVWLPCNERASGLNSRSSTPHFDSVIRRAANPEQGILTRLTHLTLAETPPKFYDPQGIPLDRLVPYLKIPSLRYIHVKRITEQKKQAVPPNFRCGITEIDLEQCATTISQLPRLLSGCSKLEAFTWILEESNRHRRMHPHSPGFHWEPHRAYAPLYQVRSTLRRLSITSHPHNGSEFLFHDDVYPQPAYFGPLCDFPVLESLCMRMVNLMPFRPGTRVPVSPLWKILPSSLRTLHITDCLVQTSHMLCDELEDLVAHCLTHLLQLKTVSITYTHFETAFGQPCISCPGGSHRRAAMRGDPVIERRLQALHVN
ncbi:hypothetical protein AbraIFM66950_009272 [Aspergillus brasiliensis]|nr:hypothetical protein AbraIFM66950_009272 [Aspergillus brasiliensis]